MVNMVTDWIHETRCYQYEGEALKQLETEAAGRQMAGD